MIKPTFTVLDCEQRSPEWYAARLGRLTGSCANEMLATVKNGDWGAGRRNLRIRLALERLTGRGVGSDYESVDMRVGREREPDAVVLYEALTGEIILPSGFLRCDDLHAGCSLDGYVGAFEGIVEVKCPKPATHWEYLKTGVIPKEYLSQVTHNLWVSGAKWCDWLSYQPDFPETLQTKLVRVVSSEFEMAIYGRQVEAFLAEVEAERMAVMAMAADAGEPVF